MNMLYSPSPPPQVASTGRAVICTIHQPSSETFFQFDRLLLLQPGGETVYFGPLGPKATGMAQYFHRVPGVQPLPLHVNPATWMLEVLDSGSGGGGGSSPQALSQGSAESDAATSMNDVQVVVTPALPSRKRASAGTDFRKHYADSALAAENAAAVAAFAQGAAMPPPSSSSPSTPLSALPAPDAKLEEGASQLASVAIQFAVLMQRALTVLWREVSVALCACACGACCRTRCMLTLVLMLPCA